MFKGAKRDVKRLNKEYQSKCIVASSDSGWMDEALTGVNSIAVRL